MSYLNFFEIFVHVVQKNESIIYLKKKSQKPSEEKKKEKRIHSCVYKKN